jgi:hypothetical protein
MEEELEIVRIDRNSKKYGICAKILGVVGKWFGSSLIKGINGATYDGRSCYDLITPNSATLSSWLTFFGMSQDVDFWILSTGEQ